MFSVNSFFSVGGFYFYFLGCSDIELVVLMGGGKI